MKIQFKLVLTFLKMFPNINNTFDLLSVKKYRKGKLFNLLWLC